MLPTPHLTLSRRLLAGLLPGLLALATLAGQPAGEKPQTPQMAEERTIESIYAEDLLRLLEEHRGKVVLVNFWATWCSPCIHEIPALLSLRDKLDPASFALLPVSLDDPADSSWLVEEFIETRFPNWFSYLSVEPESHLMVDGLDPYWPGVLPANYLIGPGGNLATTLLGGHTEAQFEEAIRAVITQGARKGGNNAPPSSVGQP